MPTRRTLLSALASATITLPLLSTAARAADTLKRGSFTGASNHVTTGTGGLITEGGKTYVSLADDFFFDGAPDPKVALGNDGYDASTLLAPLKANTGAQSYELPEGLDPANYNEIWIWCERFNVPLGVAKLN
ncbi:MAG: DM13 domain-containing protein [Pseudomonadota bacterium]